MTSENPFGAPSTAGSSSVLSLSISSGDPVLCPTQHVAAPDAKASQIAMHGAAPAAHTPDTSFKTATTVTQDQRTDEIVDPTLTTAILGAKSFSVSPRVPTLPVPALPVHQSTYAKVRSNPSRYQLTPQGGSPVGSSRSPRSQSSPMHGSPRDVPKALTYKGSREALANRIGKQRIFRVI